MTTMRLPTLLAFGLLLLLSACAQAGSSPSASSEPSAAASQPDQTRAPSKTVPASPSKEAIVNAPESIPDLVWAAVLDDISRRAGEEVTDPTVIEAHPQTWNDGSLGCPQPGQVYTQALVDGYKLVLEVDGERYDYRVGSGTDVRLCRGSMIEGG